MEFVPPTSNFLAGLTDDLAIFDGTESLEIAHNSDVATLDFETGVAERTIERTTINGCLFRQSANRNNGAVATIYDRKMGVQKDEFARWDVVVEVPALPELKILEGDSILRIRDNTVWIVQMVDYATLGTRFRLGCSKAT